MEPYFLADAPPPRYAVESDDEDEYNPLSSPSSLDHGHETKAEFRSIHDIPSRKPLVFASSEAAISWANIVDLGEQQAGVYVNKLPVGLLFRPPWTNAVIIVSEVEARTRLPLFAMAAYTKAIVERLQPTSVAILDSYPIQAYVSSRMISPDRAPIRYLCTGKKPVPDSELELFAPPNLLQATTASLLNELFLRSTREDLAQDTTAIILLPSLKAPPPPPTTFSSKGSTGDLANKNWDRETLEKAHQWLFSIVGQGVDRSSLYAHAESVIRPQGSSRIIRTALGEIGEGGLYI